MRTRLLVAFLATCVALVGIPSLSASADGVQIMPIASGLDSPRGLAFMPNGTLVVAEAGHGGDLILPNGATLGLTGQISSVDLSTGAHSPVVSGLISLLDPEGGAIGIDGLSAQGGRLLGIMGAYPIPIDCSQLPTVPADCAQVAAAAAHQPGSLLKFTPSGQSHSIANVGAFGYEDTGNLTDEQKAIYGSEHDSNPYGLLGEPGGAYVADAGANTLDWVSNNGHISVVHRFVLPDPAEPFPTDAVPTCVARSGNQLVVADLAGRIWVVDGGAATQISGPSGDPYTGGPHYTGCASDREGNVYVVSMFSGFFPNPGTGSVVKVSGGGVSSVVGGLVFPNGITVGPDDALYVTVGSVTPNGGIVKITQ